MTAVSVLGIPVGLQAVWAADAGPDDLVLEWRLDGDTADASGNGHDGTLAGQAVFADDAEGTCLSLDGAGSYVAADTGLPELTETFTVECWVKPTGGQRPYADILGNHEHDFAGFVLQQDGEQQNRYYFTYGTGAAWVYSHTVALTPDVWQHVAVTKSPERLKVYVNGLLVSSTAAPAPVRPSTTPFMVGLGIAGQERWFRGWIRDVRVWRVAKRPDLDLPIEQQIRLFEQNAVVEATTSSRWRLFRQGEAHTITFSIDPETVPDGIDEVTLILSRSDGRGHPAPVPPEARLLRAEGFRATLAVPDEPGFSRLSYWPTFLAPGDRRNLARGTLDYFVQGSPAAEETTAVQVAEPMHWTPSAVVSLDGEGWLLATDATNAGVDAGWFNAPVPEAKPTKVPWIIQDPFVGYHGVAWYWRRFNAPANPHAGGRTLLRFGAVDYKADVWVNGQPVGGHEGGETPFELDITNAVRIAEPNLLAVRVLNPTHEPIDGITLNEAPRRAKVIPYSAGASYNHGGIVESVVLASVPQAYISDLYLRPDTASGRVVAEATIHNAASEALTGTLSLLVAPAASGTTLDARAQAVELPPGDSVVRTSLSVGVPHLWDLADPYLYRVTARVVVDGSGDERSDRCGFRDFRFENGAFRLNGRRVLLRSAHTVNSTPVGQQVPGDPALFQRDILFMKTMGFNCIRFIWGGATRRQLDMCDEMGLMAYVEHAASNPMAPSPQMAGRFDRSVAETIRRDRNHPSVVMWGLLNETPDGPVFRHATDILPLVRSLDETRVVMLNSGRWDGQLEIGSLANPGGLGWDTYLGEEGPDGGVTTWGQFGGYFPRAGDIHVYPRVPHTTGILDGLRRLGEGGGPVFLSEYGIGSAVDLWRVTRHFEQLGKPEAEDALYYRERLNRFLADWDQWRLSECFISPQGFLAESLRKMARQRTLGLNIIRANPRIVAYNLTGMFDHVNCGEGLFTLFRELKPGTTDALFEGLAPLRLCLFAEPAHVRRGGRVALEGVLASEDVLAPGTYPVRLQVIGPDMARVLDRVVDVVVPPTTPEGEPPLAIPFFRDEVTVDGPGGPYRFVATMESGGAPTGGDAAFTVWDVADLPAVEAEVTLCGDSPGLREWLAARGVRVREYGNGPAPGRAVILVAGKPGADDAGAWRDLARRVASGATALFLRPDVFRRGNDPTGWLPLERKGTIRAIYGWLYLKDEWAKAHPIFHGLQSGGLMDYDLYRDIIPDLVLSGQDAPDDAICGAIKASQDYDSGLMVAEYRLGAGRFLVSTLQILENLPRDPVAERLLANALVWAADEQGEAPAPLPEGFEEQLDRFGYQ